MRINEIFYSLQGEGRNTGRAAIFIRFASCNLRCPFCDTDFKSFQEMSVEDILEAIASYPSKFVVLTGGEPTLQIEDAFIAVLHSHDYEVAIETNGTRPVPKDIDWITVSPKEAFVGEVGRIVVKQCNELKCVFDGVHPIKDYGIEAEYRYIQPCDTGDTDKNKKINQACFDYILQHPEWRLSLQTHKMIGFR